MASAMKSLDTELKVGKALSQIKELEKAFLRVSTNGVNPINRSLAQMNNLLRTSRSLASGLGKDFKNMSNAMGAVNKSVKVPKDVTPKRSPQISKSSLWDLAKSYEQSRARKASFGSDVNKKLLADAEKALMGKIGSSGLSAAMQGRLATFLPMAARLATVAGAASAAIAGITAVAAGAAAAITLLGASFAGLGMKMVESEMQLAKLQTAFQSQTRAAVEYQKAVLHAARTPFETDEVINSVVQMQVFQVDAFEKIGKSGRQLVDVLGDMAGATGTDLATATHALQRAMVGEWEIMQNNFQISARMIPKLKGLATGTTEYKRAIIDYLEQQGRFIGGQEIMAKSLRGMWSNIKDAGTNLITFTAGVADSKAELSNVTLYDKFRESLFGIYEAVSRPDVLNKYASLMSEVNAGGKDGAIAMEKLVAALGSEEKAKRLLNIANDKNIKSEYQRIQALKEAGFEEDLIYGRGQKIIAMGQMLGQIMKVVYTATFKPVLEGIGSGLDWILIKFEDVGRMLSSDKIFDQSLVKNAEDAKRSLTQIALNVGQQWGISAETMAGGIEKIVARMGESGKQFDKEIRERGLHTINGWQKAVMVFSILMEFVSLYVEDKMGGIFTLFKSFGEGFSEGLGPAMVTLKYFADQMVNVLTSLGLTNEEVTGSMKDSWKTAGYIFSTVFINPIVWYVTSAISIITTLGRVVWNVGQIIVRAVTAIIEVFTGLAAGDFTGLLETLSNIMGDFGDIFSSIKDTGKVLFGYGGETVAKFSRWHVAQSEKNWGSEPIFKQGKDNEKERKKDSEDQKKLLERQIAATNNLKRLGSGGGQNTTVNNYYNGGPSKSNITSGESVDISSKSDEYKSQYASWLENLRQNIVPEDEAKKGNLYFDSNGILKRKMGILEKDEIYQTPDKTRIRRRADGSLEEFVPVSRAVGAFNLSSDQAIFAHKGEMIIPSREADYLRSMITPNDGFSQGASLAGAMLPARLGSGGTTSKIVHSPTVNQYFMGQSGSRVATQLYGEALNLAKQVVSS